MQKKMQKDVGKRLEKIDGKTSDIISQLGNDEDLGFTSQ